MSCAKVLRSGVVLLLILGQFTLGLAQAQVSSPPTANCHVTDGTFTACSNGQTEWSDVQPLAFSATNSYLYVNQDRARTFLYLMYDFASQTRPLGPAEDVQVNFDTVEEDSGSQSLEHYLVSIFGDGHVSVVVNGQPEAPGRIVGAIEFGPSPNSARPHVTAELQVPLTPGIPTSYSPLPQFWSATPPPPPPDPCPTQPGKRFNDCVKQNAFISSIALGAASLAAAVAATECTAATASLCFPWELALMRTSYALAAAALAAGAIAGDPLGLDVTIPPDFNYTVLAQPAVYSVSLPTAGVPPQGVTAFTAIMANLEQLIALDQAAITSVGRAEGASLAGAPIWVTNQTRAAQSFGAQAGSLLNALPGLLANLAAAFKSVGAQFIRTSNDMRDFQFNLLHNSFPPAVANDIIQGQQALTELGVSSADQALISQFFLLTDPNAAAGLGIGVFPESLSDPSVATALRQFGTGLIKNLPPATTLTSSVSVTLPGDYVAAGVGLRDKATGTINISGVPVGATVVRAFLYWGMLANGEEPSLGQMNFNFNPIDGSLIGSGPDTCWGRSNSFTYRADVTPLLTATGNGTYSLTGVATGGNVLAQGASLVVIYQLDGAPAKTVMLADGNISILIGSATGTASFAGFSATAPVSAKTTFIVGDGQTFPETASFTGSAGSVTFINPFDGSDGPLWDTDTFNVSSRVGGGSGLSAAAISIGSDCLQWSAQAFSVTTPPLTTPPAATAAVVKAGVDGDTVVNLRGLSPADEPSIQDKIRMIVQDELNSNPGLSPNDLTTQLVNGLVSDGVIPPDQANTILTAVLEQIVLPSDSIPPVTTATPSPSPNVSGWNNTNVAVLLNSTDNGLNGTGVKQIAITLSGAQSGSTVVPGGVALVAITAEGGTTVTYFGTDNAGNQEAPKTLTIRIDKTPPLIFGLPTIGSCTLWPPNHQLVQVAAVTASDQLSGLAPGSLTLTGASSEPANGLGDGDSAPDIVITGNAVQVRAERSGSGTGRIYTLTTSASDLAGNRAALGATCSVSQNQP